MQRADVRKLFVASCLFLLLPGSRAAQITAAQPTVVFVSPNTANLDLSRALRRLQSNEETSLLVEGRRVACELRARPTASRALGLWQSGAEESADFEMRATRPEALYFAAELGREFRQKEVLIFRTGTGTDRLFQIVVKKKTNLRELARTVLRSGVEAATITVSRPRTVVILGSGAEEPAVRKLAAEISGDLSSRDGEIIKLGDTRNLQKAVETYDRLLANPSLGIHPAPCRGYPP